MPVDLSPVLFVLVEWNAREKAVLAYWAGCVQLNAERVRGLLDVEIRAKVRPVSNRRANNPEAIVHGATYAIKQI